MEELIHVNKLLTIFKLEGILKIPSLVHIIFKRGPQMQWFCLKVTQLVCDIMRTKTLSSISWLDASSTLLIWSPWGELWLIMHSLQATEVKSTQFGIKKVKILGSNSSFTINQLYYLRQSKWFSYFSFFSPHLCVF